jgi:hypothetical protein
MKFWLEREAAEPFLGGNGKTLWLMLLYTYTMLRFPEKNHEKIHH